MFFFELFKIGIYNNSMANNNKNTKKNTSKKKSKHHLIVKKINYYFDIIENTTSIIQYKIMDILTSGQLNITIQKITRIV